MWWHFMLLYDLVKVFVILKEEPGGCVFDEFVVITANRWNITEIDKILVSVT